MWASCTPRTYVVYGSTYYYNNGVWYTRAVHEEETVYVIQSAPEGYEVESLPEDAEVIEVDGQTYYLSEHTFYQKIQRDGEDVYVVVDPPAGAQVTSIPEDVVEHVTEAVHEHTGGFLRDDVAMLAVHYRPQKDTP